MIQVDVARDARQKRRASRPLQAGATGLASVVALMLAAAAMLSAAEIPVPSLTVGENLEIPSNLTLRAPAPTGGIQIRLTSEDPKRLLFSQGQELEGKAELTISIQAGHTGSPEFYVQGLAKSGTVGYTASAPGFETGKGTVTLVPSAIVIAGPAKFGNPLVTTSGGWPSKLMIYSALLDPAGKFVAVQQVRGGFTANVHVSSSEPSVAAVQTAALTIEGGNYTAVTQLKPARQGSATISVDVPAGFSAPAQYSSVAAQIRVPAFSLPDQITIGHNLQLGGHLTSGELAPLAGLNVTVTSSDPAKLLLSSSPTDPGSKSISVLIPSGGYSGSFFLQGVGDSGTVSYTASAPGFQTREAKINLAPSGVIITGPTGTPDEAELLRPNAPVGPNGFFAKKSAGHPIPIVVYTVQLDPVTHRCADITVQPLRAGQTLKVDLSNSDPSVGNVASSVTIQGGSSQGYAEFTPRNVGTTTLSVTTPPGFTTPTNATSLKGVVTD
jgi:hypothetical protein